MILVVGRMEQGKKTPRKKSEVDFEVYKATGIEKKSFMKKPGNRTKRTPSYQSIDSEGGETQDEPKISKEIASRMRLFESKQEESKKRNDLESRRLKRREQDGRAASLGGSQEQIGSTANERGKKPKTWQKSAAKKKSLTGTLRKFSLRPLSTRKARQEEEAEIESLLKSARGKRQMIYHRSDHEGELLPMPPPPVLSRPPPGSQRRSQNPSKEKHRSKSVHSNLEREKATQKERGKRSNRENAGPAFLKQTSSGSEGIRIGETIEEIIPGPPPLPKRSVSREKSRAWREEATTQASTNGRGVSRSESFEEAFDIDDEEGSFEVWKDGDGYTETEKRAFQTAQPRIAGTSMTREMLEEFTPREKRR